MSAIQHITDMMNSEKQKKKKKNAFLATSTHIKPFQMDCLSPFMDHFSRMEAVD